MMQQPPPQQAAPPGKQIVTIEKLLETLEMTRLNLYKSKENQGSALNHFMEIVDMIMKTVIVQDQALKEKDAKINALEGKLDKKAKGAKGVKDAKKPSITGTTETENDKPPAKKNKNKKTNEKKRK